jgi:hypothetical protein
MLIRRKKRQRLVSGASRFVFTNLPEIIKKHVFLAGFPRICPKKLRERTN